MPEIIIAPGEPDEKILDESDIVGNLTPKKVPTGVGMLRATIFPDRSIDTYAERQNRATVKTDDGTVVWTGYLLNSDRTRSEVNQDLKGAGIAKKLEETRPEYENISGSVTYSDIALDDAITDYWGRTPFNNVTVYDQPTEVIAQDEQLQQADTTSELQNITSFDATEPVTVDNGFIKLLQSGYFAEAETSGGAGGTVSDSPASDGEAVSFFDSIHSTSYDFDLDYTIPSENVGVAFRIRNPFDPDSDFTFEGSVIELTVNGENLGPVAGDASDDTYDWSQETSYSGNDLSGTITVEFDAVTDAISGAANYLDAVFLYDDRFSYTFDNSVDGNGYLSGPELYPSVYDIAITQANAGFNITEATVNLSIDDTSNNQAIGISFDGGSTYDTATNTNTHTASNAGESRTVDVELSLSRYGSRTTATPTTGFNGQQIDTYELLADLNNLIVVDELELTRNHFDNLKQLHNYGDFVFAIEHTDDDIADIPVFSFLRGTQTRPAPSEFSDPIDETDGIQSGAYYNVIYLQGAEDAQGDRPTAEVKADQSVIDTDRGEISPGVLRDPNITTEAGARFRAQALLDAAQKQNDLIGTKTIYPVNLTPGFSYEVDLGEGSEDKVLQQVTLNYGEQIQSTAEFLRETRIAEEINELSQNTRDIGNQV